MEKNIYVITGHYGSGKSEFSINFARKLLKTTNRKLCLADLDIVNPYFRSREVRESLIEEGIDVVSDTLNSTKGLDMPFLSPAVRGQIVSKEKDVILDCGGDDVGVRVLKQFDDEIRMHNHEVYMVINTFRSQTGTVRKIIDMKEELERESGFEITAFINNSNFLRQTTVDDLVNSDRILKEVSQLTNIPVKYTTGMKSLIEKLPDDISGQKLILDLSLRSDWL
ncbi:P-loop NTPase family protein [Haloplasma contractile]|uniref:ATP-GTP-binding protein n=1 Tax=Haloplasma contractile SSD-17B TaxID=1033810 RepID=U2E8W5_9MOLU|nr:hypothetical protein [Haloplasma contractile]ERJ11583.1 Putative ATP-GTP-binding protein [Haloplasma contractile SSD-17B]